MPGFVWHAVGAREHHDAVEGDVLTLWLPIFAEYPSDIPIHLPREPPSYLHKVTINTSTKEVPNR